MTEPHPYENVEIEVVTPEYIENHVSIFEKGFYDGSWIDTAALLGYNLTLHERHMVFEQAHFSTKQMVMSGIFDYRPMTEYEKADFDFSFQRGFMEGQSKVAKELFNLAMFGDFKAIDKFLEVRGAFGAEQTDTGPSIEINVIEDDSVIEGEVAEDNTVINFPER